MHNTFCASALTAIVSLAMACSPDAQVHGNQGGEGGAGGGGASSGPGTPSSSSGEPPSAVPCISSGQCAGRNGMETCNVEVCREGYCTIIFDGFGVSCGHDWWEICDGRGNCGEWLPRDAEECYTPFALTPTCPLCDDGDPATYNTCKPLPEFPDQKICTNPPAKEGFVCGPAYTIQNGKCCPGWGT